MFLYHMLRIFPFAAAFLNMQNSRQTHQRDIVPGTNPVKMIVLLTNGNFMQFVFSRSHVLDSC